MGESAGLEGMEEWLCLSHSSYDTYRGTGGVVPAVVLGSEVVFTYNSSNAWAQASGNIGWNLGTSDSFFRFPKMSHIFLMSLLFLNQD